MHVACECRGKRTDRPFTRVCTPPPPSNHALPLPPSPFPCASSAFTVSRNEPSSLIATIGAVAALSPPSFNRFRDPSSSSAASSSSLPLPPPPFSPSARPPCFLLFALFLFSFFRRRFSAFLRVRSSQARCFSSSVWT